MFEHIQRNQMKILNMNLLKQSTHKFGIGKELCIKVLLPIYLSKNRNI